MEHERIKQMVRDIIKEATGKELKVPVYVRDIHPQGYSIGIELRQYDPTWLNVEIPDEGLEECLREYLPRNGAIRNTIYIKVERNTDLDHSLNSFRSPYDLKRI